MDGGGDQGVDIDGEQYVVIVEKVFLGQEKVGYERQIVFYVFINVVEIGYYVSYQEDDYQVVDSQQ